jgi:predicted aspartyl protease
LGNLGQGQDSLKLKGKVHEEVYSFLVDTGATHNFVPKSFVRDNGLQVEKGSKVKVKLANGDYVISNNYVKCMVDFGKVSGFLQFTVLPSCPLILGMSFLRVFKPTLDFDTMQVVLDNSGTSSCHV